MSVNKIEISSNDEKGVDIAVATRLIEVSDVCEIICLISSDKDYIPVLEYLKRNGKYVLTMGIDEKHPIELKNLSFSYLDITDFLVNYKDNYNKYIQPMHYVENGINRIQEWILETKPEIE